VERRAEDGGGAEVSGPGCSRQLSRCTRRHNVYGRDGVGGGAVPGAGAESAVVAGRATTSGREESQASPVQGRFRGEPVRG
jgi:hypothetical protein